MAKWNDTEQVVAHLEKSLRPDARVRHNIHLPVLGSPTGKKRQCDVVIIYGKPPRETITIVEVQDRQSKVEINTFGGWIRKKEQVGAQHLICVSRLPYPDSIIEEAAEYGPGVRLMKLEELERNEVPEEIRGGYTLCIYNTYPRICVHMHSTNALPPPDRRNLEPGDRTFILHGNRISISELYTQYVNEFYRNKSDEDIIKDKQQFRVLCENIGIIQDHNVIVPIKLTITGQLSVKCRQFDISYESYTQDDETLMWSVLLKDDETGEMFRIPFYRDVDGRLKARALGIHKNVYQNFGSFILRIS